MTDLKIGCDYLYRECINPHILKAQDMPPLISIDLDYQEVVSWKQVTILDFYGAEQPGSPDMAAVHDDGNLMFVSTDELFPIPELEPIG